MERSTCLMPQRMKAPAPCYTKHIHKLCVKRHIHALCVRTEKVVASRLAQHKKAPAPRPAQTQCAVLLILV